MPSPAMISQDETAVLTMADIHFGKKTKSYNPDVFCERMTLLGDKLARIKRCLRGYSFDRLVIAMLGDVNDGTDIYATQSHHQAESNVEQQAEMLSSFMAKWLRQQAKVWRHIRVECVAGNHGRAGRHCHEAANWDVVAYRYTKHKVEADGRIEVCVGDSNSLFLRKVKIRGYQFVLYHGHDIRTYASIPWYGIMLRTARWHLSSLNPFDVLMMGHFHSFGCWVVNRVHILLSGTLVTDDLWALQSLGWESANRWWLFGVSNRHPISWQFALDL